MEFKGPIYYYKGYFTEVSYAHFLIKFDTQRRIRSNESSVENVTGSITRTSRNHRSETDKTQCSLALEILIIISEVSFLANNNLSPSLSLSLSLAWGLSFTRNSWTSQTSKREQRRREFPRSSIKRSSSVSDAQIYSAHVPQVFTDDIIRSQLEISFRGPTRRNTSRR